MAAYIRDLKYHGPVALSCDDTKAHPALRTRFDHEINAYRLLGVVGDPPLVENPEELEAALQECRNKKATKVCPEIR